MVNGENASSITCTLALPHQCINVGSFKDCAKSGHFWVVAVWLYDKYLGVPTSDVLIVF